MANRVSECGGVWASKSGDAGDYGWVDIREVGKDAISLEINGRTRTMTIEAARSLARQLYRLARRVEAAQCQKS